MSLLPPYQSSNAEAALWSDVPRGLEGKATSLRELRKQFSGIHPVYKDEFVVIYGIGKARQERKLSNSRIAYTCKRQRRTFYGPPLLDDVHFSPRDVLCGREGYDARCKNCGEILYSHTDRNS